MKALSIVGEPALAAKTATKHQLRVRSLFNDLRTLSCADTEAVSALEHRAQSRQPRWKAELMGHLDAHVAAGRMTTGQRAFLLHQAERCEEGSPELLDFALPAVWTCLIAITALFGWALALSTLTISVVMLSCAAVGGIWVWRQRWFDPAANADAKWQRPLFSTLGAAGAAGLALVLPTLVGELMEAQSIHAFNVDRAAVLRDPAGFPMLKKFARDNYDVEVVLGTAVDSWAATSLALPGSSVASMQLGHGYCQLNLYRDNLLNGFSPDGGIDKVLWTQGVMMHEFGHCLDTRRDTNELAQHNVQTYSIAPVDAKSVKDLDTYLDATDKAATKLWREALADMFAIGYWRLAAPDEATTLTTALERKRNSAAKQDPTHSTSCWIKFAASAPAPESAQQLLGWADELRAKAPCAVTHPPRTTAWDRAMRQVAQWLKKQPG